MHPQLAFCSLCLKEQHWMFRPWTACQSRPKVTWATANEHHKVKTSAKPNSLASSNTIISFISYQLLAENMGWAMPISEEAWGNAVVNKPPELTHPLKHILSWSSLVCIYLMNDSCPANFTKDMRQLGHIAHCSLANYSQERVGQMPRIDFMHINVWCKSGLLKGTYISKCYDTGTLLKSPNKHEESLQLCFLTLLDTLS